jgi:polyisoprenoid-binding protein YceI
MKKLTLAGAIVAILAGSASLAVAEVTQWKFDPTHSEATFGIRHWFTTVNGRFNTMSGSIAFDDKDWSKSSVEATIETGSIFTNNERRDGHLKSPDFFDAANHPTITFKSTKVTKGAGNDFSVEGDFTMHGVTKKVTLAATFLGSMDVGNGRSKAGWTAKTKVNRKDYNLTWNRTLDNGQVMLADDVDITLNIEADKVVPGQAAQGAPAATPPATPAATNK